MKRKLTLLGALCATTLGAAMLVMAPMTAQAKPVEKPFVCENTVCYVGAASCTFFQGWGCSLSNGFCSGSGICGG